MKRSSSSKKVAVPKTVEAYLAAVPEPARSTLETVRAAIKSVVPKETTEVISYGIPAFRHEIVLVWYAAFSDHCSLFPTASVIEKFKDELTNFHTSKGTIQFPVDKPPSAALVRKLVKARLARGRPHKKVAGRNLVRQSRRIRGRRVLIELACE